MVKIKISNDDFVDINIELANNFLLKAEATLDKEKKKKSLFLANQSIAKALEMLEMV